jgi:GntR family transcriptional repressor for pyruvate dehydrogenase complex
VSRASLREALAALTQAGVIETRGKQKLIRKSSADVQELSRRTVHPARGPSAESALDVRLLLEPQVAAVAASSISPDELDELAEWVRLTAEMSLSDRADRSDRVAYYDAQFHLSLSRVLRNATLTSIVSALVEATPMHPTSDKACVSVANDHQLVVDALRAGSAAGARDAMSAHLTASHPTT